MSTTDLFSGVLPFLHTADERSFRRAAARLGVTPAAVSKAVGKLEGDLGVRLLARTSRRVELTPEGERFLARCREAVGSIEVGRQMMSEARSQPKGEVHLSMPFILGRLLVPSLPAMTARYPSLVFRIAMTDRFVPLVAERVDVALRIGEVAPSSLVVTPLRRTRWATVAAPPYVAARGIPREPADLERHNVLLFLGSNGKPRAPIFFDKDGSVPTTSAVRGNLLIDQGDHMLDACVAGLGVCQVLDFMVAEHLAAGRLIELLTEHAAPGPPVSALVLPERRRAPNVRALLGLLGEVIGAKRR